MMNFKKQVMMTLVGASVLGSFQGVQAVLPEFADVAQAKASMQVVSRTFEALKANEQGNEADLVSLWAPIQALQGDAAAQVRAWLLETLNSDWKAYQAVNACESVPGADRTAYMEFRSSLVKLVGTSDHTGLMEDVIGLVTHAETVAGLFQGMEALKSQPNLLTQLKLLGIYANYYLGNMELIQNLKGLYPAAQKGTRDCPSQMSDAVLAKIQPGVLSMPSRGFTYGGNVNNGGFFMGDSSSWVSYLTQSSQRLSTGIICAAVEPVENQNAEMQGYVDVFNGDFQSVSPDDMQPGDILVWCGAPRHAAIVVGWADAEHTKVYASDNRRADTKAYEGPELREIELNWNTGLHVVRRIKATPAPSAEPTPKSDL